MVEPISFSEPVCSDPDDNKFLEAALAADANYIVSGDTALLNLKSHVAIRALFPGQDLVDSRQHERGSFRVERRRNNKPSVNLQAR